VVRGGFGMGFGAALRALYVSVVDYGGLMVAREGGQLR
jgi:hypothetical protein